jgi:hypothetical protein
MSIRKNVTWSCFSLLSQADEKDNTVTRSAQTSFVSVSHNDDDDKDDDDHHHHHHKSLQVVILKKKNVRA